MKLTFCHFKRHESHISEFFNSRIQRFWIPDSRRLVLSEARTFEKLSWWWNELDTKNYTFRFLTANNSLVVLSDTISAETKVFNAFSLSVFLWFFAVTNKSSGLQVNNWWPKVRNWFLVLGNILNISEYAERILNKIVKYINKTYLEWKSNHQRVKLYFRDCWWKFVTGTFVHNSRTVNSRVKIQAELGRIWQNWMCYLTGGINGLHIGYEAKYIRNPRKVLMKGFEIPFKILSVYCEYKWNRNDWIP